MPVYLTNGVVAWEVPGGHIGTMYKLGYYLPPPAWRVKKKLNGERPVVMRQAASGRAADGQQATLY